MVLLWCTLVERIIMVLAARMFKEVAGEHSLILSVPKMKLLVAGIVIMT